MLIREHLLPSVTICYHPTVIASVIDFTYESSVACLVKGLKLSMVKPGSPSLR